MDKLDRLLSIAEKSLDFLNLQEWIVKLVCYDELENQAEAKILLLEKVVIVSLQNGTFAEMRRGLFHEIAHVVTAPMKKIIKDYEGDNIHEKNLNEDTEEKIVWKLVRILEENIKE